jgi:hypothetical protein
MNRHSSNRLAISHMVGISSFRADKRYSCECPTPAFLYEMLHLMKKYLNWIRQYQKSEAGIGT